MRWMKGREDDVPNQTVTKQIRSLKPFCEGGAIERGQQFGTAALAAVVSRREWQSRQQRS